MVKDQVNGPAALQSARQALHQAATESGDADGRGRPAPTEDQRDFGFSLVEVEGLKMARDSPRKPCGVDGIAQVHRRPQDLQVFSREQLIVGAIDGVAAHLNRVLRGAHDRSAYAFARGHERPLERAVACIAAERRAQRGTEIAEGLRFLTVDILADTA